MRFITKLNELLGLELSPDTTEVELDDALDTVLEKSVESAAKPDSASGGDSSVPSPAFSAEISEELDARILALEQRVNTLSDSIDALLTELADVESKTTQALTNLQTSIGAELNKVKVQMNTPKKDNNSPLNLPEKSDDKVTVNGDFLSEWLN